MVWLRRKFLDENGKRYLPQLVPATIKHFVPLSITTIVEFDESVHVAC